MPGYSWVSIQRETAKSSLSCWYDRAGYGWAIRDRFREPPWLDSIVYAFLAGQSAESVAQAFPLLTLDQLYGAIAYYLAHREEIDRYLEMREKDFEAKRNAARETDPMFVQRLAHAKKPTPSVP